MKPYDELPLIPELIAETVATRPYTGEEISMQIRDAAAVGSREAARQRMTPADVAAFCRTVDVRCRAAYAAQADWFMRIVRAKGNAGRDQLYVWVAHWFAGYLHDPKGQIARFS